MINYDFIDMGLVYGVDDSGKNIYYIEIRKHNTNQQDGILLRQYTFRNENSANRSYKRKVNFSFK